MAMLIARCPAQSARPHPQLLDIKHFTKCVLLKHLEAFLMEYLIIMGCCVVQNIQEICFSFIEWNSGILLVCYVALFSQYACLSVAPGLCMNTPS